MLFSNSVQMTADSSAKQTNMRLTEKNTSMQNAWITNTCQIATITFIQNVALFNMHKRLIAYTIGKVRTWQNINSEIQGQSLTMALLCAGTTAQTKVTWARQQRSQREIRWRKTPFIMSGLEKRITVCITWTHTHTKTHNMSAFSILAKHTASRALRVCSYL